MFYSVARNSRTQITKGAATECRPTVRSEIFLFSAGIEPRERVLRGCTVGAALRGRPSVNLKGRLAGVPQPCGDPVDRCREGVVQIVVVLTAAFPS